jgi:lipoprotein NlpD
MKKRWHPSSKCSRRWPNALFGGLLFAAGLVLIPEAPHSAANAQAVSVLGAQRHTVQSGDTVFGLAARYRTPIQALVQENRLQPPFTLFAGQVLRIPAPRTYRVREGETFQSIGSAQSIDPRSLALLNALTPGSALVAGQVLILPALPRPSDQSPLPTSPAPLTIASRAQPVVLGGRSTFGSVRNAGQNSRFLWPVEGNILRLFGPEGVSRHSDGIEIAAAPGSSVLAAADGEVVYVGSDLESLGKLVLIRHPGGWMTAYGQLDRVNVRESRRVSRGQSIGTVANQVDALGPRLVFQLRRGRSAVDPMGQIMLADRSDQAPGPRPTEGR